MAGPKSKSVVSRELIGALSAALVVVAYCLWLLRSNPGLFFNDDYQLSILPVFADVARAWSEGHWPLLSPYSWACGNLAGEYQYGTFSIFVNTVVVVVWKFSLTLAQRAAALSITHLAVLAAGAYLLARVRKLPTSLALGVALIASLNGWEMGWGATDWFGALAAHAWLPWCWWAFEVGSRPVAVTGHLRTRLRALLPVPFVYLLLTGGFPYTVVMLGLVTAWMAVEIGWTGRAVRRRLQPLALGWFFGLLLSAPAWLSLLETMHDSSRSQNGVGVGKLAWTVPVAALPGLVLPNWTNLWPDFANQPCVHGALELAGGLVPTVGILAGLCVLRLRAMRALRWELILSGTVLLLCLLPSPGLFRWSFRWLPLLHLVLALTGAKVLHLLAVTKPGGKFQQNPGVWCVGLVTAVWLAMRVFHTANPDPLTAGMAPFVLAVAIIWAVIAALPVRPRWRLWGAAVAVFGSLFGTYRFAHINTGLPIYPAEANLTRIEPLSRDRLYLSLYREPDRFYRVWQVPPGFGAVVRMGSIGMYAGIHMLNGYSPIMSKGVGKAFGIETHGNVPEVVGERLLLNEAGPDGLLARIGVDAIIVTHDYQTGVRPPAPTWEMTQSFDEGDVYQRAAPILGTVRSWLSAEPSGVELYAPVEISIIENARQRVEAVVKMPPGDARPGLLAFARPFYPGYRATLAGQSLKVGSFRELLPTVELPPGSAGRLVLTYAPTGLVYGLWLTGLAFVGVSTFLWWPQSTRLPSLG